MKKLKRIVAMVMALTLFAGMTVSAADTPFPKSKTVKVLMIGDGLTARENGDNKTIPYLKGLAKNAGRKISITKVTHNAESMKNWANPKNKYGKKAYKAVDSKEWDVVILQDNTDWAIGKSSTSQKSLKKLTEYILKGNPNARILYNSTWAYNKTIKRFGKTYSYSAQRKKINATYSKAANMAHAEVVWSGDAFHEYKKIQKSKTLYLGDKKHPNKYGAMMNACCLYTKIFQADPSESSYRAGLDKTVVKKMKKIAMECNPQMNDDCTIQQKGGMDIEEINVGAIVDHIAEKAEEIEN